MKQGSVTRWRWNFAIEVTLRSSAIRVPALFAALLMVLPACFAQTAAAAPAVPVFTLQQAIAQAETNDPTYATAQANRGIADAGRGISRSALLPTVTYNTQYLYTQPNGKKVQTYEGEQAQDAPLFIANNAIHEYISQALVTENLSLVGFFGVKRANAAAAQATATAEVARRNLVVRVVTAYYTLVAAQNDVEIARQAEAEAQSFVSQTKKLEAGREVAYADVVKATLSLQQRQRNLADAQLAAQTARLNLGVMILRNPGAPYRLADSSLITPPLPSRAESEAAASKNNPDLKSALAALQVSKADVAAARAAYLPSLSFNYTYGIDAQQFDANGPDGARNLGYSAYGSINVPVWDWFATHDRVKQSEFQRKAAQVQLSFTQKKLLADFDEYYGEAKTANDELASLDASVKMALQSLHLTRLRYGAGEATVLEVVDAENTASQAEMARAAGDVRYRVALANLQTLTGAL